MISRIQFNSIFGKSEDCSLSIIYNLVLDSFQIIKIRLGTLFTRRATRYFLPPPHHFQGRARKLCTKYNLVNPPWLDESMVSYYLAVWLYDPAPTSSLGTLSDKPICTASKHQSLNIQHLFKGIVDKIELNLYLTIGIL